MREELSRINNLAYKIVRIVENEKLSLVFAQEDIRRLAQKIIIKTQKMLEVK